MTQEEAANILWWAAKRHYPGDQMDITAEDIEAFDMAIAALRSPERDPDTGAKDAFSLRMTAIRRFIGIKTACMPGSKATGSGCIIGTNQSKNTAGGGRMKQPKRKTLTQTQRMAVYEKCQGHCAYCGTPLEYRQMQVDHITPIELAHVARVDGNDVNNLDNLLPACRPCNYIKSSLMLEKFRNIITRWPDSLERDSVTYRNALRFGVVEARPHTITFYFEKIGLDVPDYTAEMNQMYREAREMLHKKREEARHEE